MKDAAVVPTLTRREDYLPPSHTIEWVNLEFDLALETTLVSCEFGFRSNPARGSGLPLRLCGDELEFVDAWLDDQHLEPSAYSVGEDYFELHHASHGRLRIQTRIHPSQNTQLMGLYASGSGLYTQCESEGFRRIAYFLDRPDVLAVYTVTLKAPADYFPVLLSNGNLMEETVEQGIRRAVWHDPFPKPSYLFALVAADLTKIEKTIQVQSGEEKLLQVYTKPQDIGKATHALACLERAVAWDEHRFGLALDLERFMIVAVPDFNSGAMENKGLNLFNTRFVLADADTATDRDYELIEAVIGHEYFHNWTGNRITCRDWFQLTLKEGLTVFRDQEFTADMLSSGLSEQQAASARAVKRIDDVRTLRALQFPEDAGPMAHPIRPAAYQEIRNFYTATIYEKGAEVIRQLQTLFGVDGFRKGMDLYFQRHDGEAASCEDFVSSILDANDHSDWFEPFMRWYSTLGTPRLSVSSQWHADAAELEVVLTQTLDPRNQDQTQPLMIPVGFGLIGQDGHPWSDPQLPNTLLLQEASATFRFQLPAYRGHAAPVCSLLRGFSSPVHLEANQSVEALQCLARFDTDPFNRWEACQRLILEALLPHAAHIGSDVQRAHAVTALQAVWDDPHASDAFKAAALSLPSESVVAEAWAARAQPIDPLRIHQAVERMQTAIAEASQDRFLLLDRTLDQAAPAYEPSPLDVARRSIQHLAQSALTQILPHEARADQLLARFRMANNITSRMALLGLLCRIGGQQALLALDEFADKYAGNALAMDKWFAVQVYSIGFRDPAGLTVLERVRGLLKDSRFDPGNPNRVLSVLGVYFRQCPVGFHREDGQGYALWADILAELDARNSSLAARLARSLDRWQAYAPPIRTQMQLAIERLQSQPSLSTDLSEVCGRLLQVSAESKA
jgi:aminopeptidase N